MPQMLDILVQSCVLTFQKYYHHQGIFLQKISNFVVKWKSFDNSSTSNSNFTHKLAWSVWTIRIGRVHSVLLLTHLYLDKKIPLWTLLFDICYHAKLKICGNDVRNTELKSRAFWNTATNDSFFVVGRKIEYWFTWFFKTLL